MRQDGGWGGVEGKRWFGEKQFDEKLIPENKLNSLLSLCLPSPPLCFPSLYSQSFSLSPAVSLPAPLGQRVCFDCGIVFIAPSTSGNSHSACFLYTD